MPRADKKAISAETEKQADLLTQDDPTNGFDDLRRITDPVPELDDGKIEKAQADKVEEKPDDDLDSMTNAMRKRLTRDRKRSERKIAEKEADFNAALEAQNQRIAELESRLQGEAKSAGKADDEVVSDLEAKLEAAMEKGDSKAVAKLNTQLAQAVSDKMVASRSHKPDEPQDLPQKAKAEPVRPPDKIIPRVQQWIDDQPWWDDQEFAHVRNFVARTVDRKLQAAGYSPRDDDYFDEVERIVDEKYPGVVQKTRTSDREREFLDRLGDEEDSFQVTPKDKATRRPTQRVPVGGNDDGADSGSGDEPPRRRGATRLSTEDVRTMRTFGLDPQNPKHVEGFIQNRGTA